MLYGMDDDLEYFDDYGQIKKSKLNIKKLIIFIIIFLICFFSVLGNFFIRSEIKNNELSSNTEKSINDQKQNEKNVYVEKTENLTPVQYEGNHAQIATHDTERIKKKLFVPQANLNGQQQIKDIYFSEEKQVYLTFDDGPSKDITPQVLDILKQYEVKATFFVLGARVDLYPDTLKRIYNEGHYIANHGYSHEYKSIYQSKDTVFQEYVECEISIKRALTNDDYNSYLFRFPGGSSGGRYSKIKSEAREFLNGYGVAYTNWNCLTGDAEGKETKEECIEELINTKADQNSLVILMHDSNDKQQTVDSLPEIIQYLKNEGYIFKTFYEIF